jgi:hypothetical protein
MQNKKRKTQFHSGKLANALLDDVCAVFPQEFLNYSDDVFLTPIGAVMR